MVFENYLTDGDGISTAADNNMTVFSHKELPKARANAEKQAALLDEVTKEFLKRV